MSETPLRRHDQVAAVGLALGAVCGMAGTMVAQAPLRQVLWAIDGVGIVVATALMALKYFRKGNDWLAAGFLVFTVGEALLLSGTAAGLAGSVPSFAGGVALWATALFMTSIPPGFATWIRLVGIAAAMLFAVTAVRIFLGEQLLPTTAPLPSLGYPVLVATFGGWIWTLLKGDR